MKILSIDTSSNVCGVSILENTNLLCKLDTSTGRTHSENLMPMIDEALKSTNLSPQNLDLIVCDIGPGSFTGIRIGVATAKAFSDSLDIPCVGVSSLETLAFGMMFLGTDLKCITYDVFRDRPKMHQSKMFLGTEPKNISPIFGSAVITSKDDIKYVCSIIDCKNDNCYFALYEKKDDDLITLIEPQAESAENALAILDSYCQDTLNYAPIAFCGDGAQVYRSAIEQSFGNSIFPSSDFNVLNSEALGLAGFSKFSSGEELQDVLPLYLKKPQAQRQLENKELNQKK